MKRSLAFLLAMIMVIGMIPATLLPVLAHGIGVGVNNVQNLSIDNAPNQKIPATVTVDGDINDTAWKTDEWNYADATYGIWDTASASNGEFSYRYQLHLDYEFVYGIIQFDTSKVTSGELNDFTVWISNRLNENDITHYTSKIELKNGGTKDNPTFGIAVYQYGSEDPVTSKAQYDYEKSYVAQTNDGKVWVIEFKALLADVLGAPIDKNTVINLSSFVSANVGGQRLYHPRMDAARENKSIDLANSWPTTGAVKITQKEIYAETDSEGYNGELAYNNIAFTNYGVNVDGLLDEEAWKDFTNYGASNYNNYTEYLKYNDGAGAIASYDVDYSTVYRYRVQNTTDTGTSPRMIYYHVNNVDYNFPKDSGSSGDVNHTPGYYNGETTANNKVRKEHVCTQACQTAYIENVPVKFKYSVKSDGKYLYGAMVVSLSAYNTDFYYDTSKGWDTYFKVMIAAKGDESNEENGSTKWTRYTQLELKHTLTSNSPVGYSHVNHNSMSYTSNSYFNSGDDVGAYARRIDSNTMVFEFCISFDEMNAHKKDTSTNANADKFGPNTDLNIMLTVGNMTSSVSSTGPASPNGSGTDLRARHASNAGYFAHAGYYSILGDKKTENHIYRFDGTDPAFSPALANGTLDAGIFNGLIAVDRYVSGAYRKDNNISQTVIKNSSPAITANVDEVINLKTFAVVFDGDTTATAAENITWKNGNNTITTYTPEAKGVTTLTATAGSKTKSIYVVAKKTGDNEYVLYEADMGNGNHTTKQQLEAEGWSLDGSPTVSESGGYLQFAKNTVLLPEWLGAFGDYTFTAEVQGTDFTDAERWQSLIYRYASANSYYQMAVRKNTSLSAGIEFAEGKNGGFTVHKKNSSPSNLTDRTDIGKSKRIMRVEIKGGSFKYSIDNITVMEYTDLAEHKTITKGGLGFTANNSTMRIYKIKVTIPENERTVNNYFNGSEAIPGGIMWYDYDIFMDTEYLYGAAVIKKNGYKSKEGHGSADLNPTSYSTEFLDSDYFRIWINNDTPQYNDTFDAVVGFHLNSDTVDYTVPSTGTTYYSDGSTYTKSTAWAKGSESFQSLPKASKTRGIVYKRTVLDSTTYEGDTTSGEIVMIEFKIPLENIGVTEKYMENLTTGSSPTAVSYYVSAETCTNYGGLVSPIPEYRHAGTDNDGTPYMEDKLISLGAFYKSADKSKSANGWITTVRDGVNGSHFITSEERTNMVKVDGVLSDVVWNDTSERIQVNSYNGTWSSSPSAQDVFDYSYKVYTGREAIYGMAEINTVAGNGETLDFTLWINNNVEDETNKKADKKADKKFRIVQSGDTAICYGLNGEVVSMTFDETRWGQGHKLNEDEHIFRLSYGQIAMTNDGTKTYVEFMFSLEGLEIVLHENGEDKWTRFMSKGLDDDWHQVGDYRYETDKFFYYWNPDYKNDKGEVVGRFEENKKKGFEYFVSVTKTVKDKSITLYYPPVASTAASSVADKFCANTSGDAWDDADALEITTTGYYVPESITIDGNLTDSGWDDDRWTLVQAGVNGNLMTEGYYGVTEADYKYQMRVDHENVYLAVVIDAPASPIYYNETCGCANCAKGDYKKYSVPSVKFWIKSGDKDYSIEVDHQGLGEKTYTYKDDAVSFTHLYELSLAADKNTGEPVETTLNVDKAEYVPNNYVTWERNDTPHEAANEYIKLNSGISITYSGTTALRHTTHDTGFYAPYGGLARNGNDPLGAVSYTIKKDGVTITTNSNNKNSDGKYPTNHDATDYEASLLFGETKVIEENTVTAINENAYTDKDWYAKPEIKKYVYGNEHGVVTSDPTGTKTNVEFRFALSEIGCEDGDEFQYYIQAGTTGTHDDRSYWTFYPPISLGFDKADGRGDTNYGRPYCYWGTNAKVVDKAEREYLFLNNSFGPVSGIGSQKTENYEYIYNGVSYGTYYGIKFGVMYNSDYIRQPADKTGKYDNATYWDVKEIGMLIAYTDSLGESGEGNAKLLTTDNVDNYNIYRMESDIILDHVNGTNMADYENYVFYAIQLLYPTEKERDTKLTYRGFMEYYPSDQIYYNMAERVFGENWTYSTDKSSGKYLGKPLSMDGVNNDPTKIPKTYTFRETYYCEPVTRSMNMIDRLKDKLTVDVELVDTNRVTVPTIDNWNNTEIVYVPMDNRPVNLDKVKYEAEAAGFTLVTPPEELFSTTLDTNNGEKSDQGDTAALYNWLKSKYNDGNGNKYFVISIDQMLSGGLISSRDPFLDTDASTVSGKKESSANSTVLSGYSLTAGKYTLSTAEEEIIALLKEIAENDTTYTVFFDTVMRDELSDYYFGTKTEINKYANLARKQLHSNELTIDNLVKSYNLDANGNAIASGTGNTYSFTSDGKTVNITKAQYQKYVAARERKLRIADALYPTLTANANAFYVGYDGVMTDNGAQTNDGRYIEEKLIKESPNTIVCAGTDSFGMMGVASVTTNCYGSVSVNVEFFGMGKDMKSDGSDLGTLYNNVMARINGVGAKYAYDKKGEVDVLVLTRSIGDKPTPIKESAFDLMARLETNLANNIPTIVVDGSTHAALFSAMMLDRYASLEHNSDVSEQLNELLAYSQMSNTSVSLGTAISNGISRYTYLKNSPKVTDESNQGAIKVNVDTWVKDYVYKNTEPVNSLLNRDNPNNNEDTFGNRYNNFWEFANYTMAKLNASDVIVGVDKNGKTITEKPEYQASVSDLGWRWDRENEGEFEIKVDRVESFIKPDYRDYKVTNLALGKSYSTNMETGAMPNGDQVYDDYMGQEMTNGVRVYQNSQEGYGYEHAYWSGWDIGNATDDVLEITIDLGAEYPVYQVNIDCLSMGLGSDGTAVSGVYTPEYIEFLTSNSKDSGFELQRKITPTPVTTKSVTRYYLGTNRSAVTARYVKLRIKDSDNPSNVHWFFCSEIEVLGIDGTRAEYADSTGLYFSYTVDGTPYVYKENNVPKMTEDSGNRLLMFYSDTTTNYSMNMINPDKVFTPWSDDYISGYKSGTKDGDLTTKVKFDLKINETDDFRISQVAVHTGEIYAGIGEPTNMSLEIVMPDGSTQAVETNLYEMRIYNPRPDKNDGGTAAIDFRGTRWVLEPKDESVYLPVGGKLRVTVWRERDTGYEAYIFAGIQIIGRYDNKSHVDDVVVEPQKAVARYEFANDKAGFAEGTISVAPVASKPTSGYYLVYYTDDNGVLAGYDEIASIKATGETVSYTVPEGVMIPEGATGIAVFESASAHPTNAPNISTAVATKTIPTAKRLALGEAQTVFAVTSDVDIYDSTNNATGKYADALSFFKQQGAEHVVVTGDITGNEGNGGKTLAQQYTAYTGVVDASPYSKDTIYEAMGDKANGTGQRAAFVNATGREGNQTETDTKLTYFSVYKAGESGEKDNVFIFTRVTGDNYPGFSPSMYNYVKGEIEKYYNKNVNIFLIIHKPFVQRGVGSEVTGDKSDFIDLTVELSGSSGPVNESTEKLLKDYPNVIVMSGHTHNSFYTSVNYSNDNGEFAHTVHVPSVTSPTADGRQTVGANYGSEGYIVKCYEDYIVYTGYNLSTGKIIPGACIIIPTA